jgi:hypothetical protein
MRMVAGVVTLLVQERNGFQNLDSFWAGHLVARRLTQTILAGSIITTPAIAMLSLLSR